MKRHLTTLTLIFFSMLIYPQVPFSFAQSGGVSIRGAGENDTFPLSLAKRTDISVRVAVGRELYNSGLLSEIFPPFERRHRTWVDIVETERDEMLELAIKGEVDAVISTDISLISTLIGKGYGTDKERFMSSYLMLVGPASDPAGIRGERARYAMYMISEKKSPFFSASDSSDIYRAENLIWRSIDQSTKMDGWHRNTGKGLEDTLLIANEMKGYTICDKQTYALLKEMIGLVPLGKRDDDYLKNEFYFISVNPNRHLTVRYGAASLLREYLLSKEAKEIINGFAPYSEQIFHSED